MNNTRFRFVATWPSPFSTAACTPPSFFPPLHRARHLLIKIPNATSSFSWQIPPLLLSFPSNSRQVPLPLLLPFPSFFPPGSFFSLNNATKKNRVSLSIPRPRSLPLRQSVPTSSQISSRKIQSFYSPVASLTPSLTLRAANLDTKLGLSTVPLCCDNATTRK